MGFYQPAQLVRDARDHGVVVLPACVTASGWDSALEGPTDAHGRRAVRLGLRQIKGLSLVEAEGVAAAREAGADSVSAYALKSGLSRRPLELLAEADAFAGLGCDRRQALWAVKGLATDVKAPAQAPLLARQTLKEATVMLPFMGPAQEVAEDYRTTSLSLKAHPCGFFREDLARLGAVPARALATLRDRRRVSVGGLVLVRQRPGTAKGVVFLTLEDETGAANIVIWKDAFEANRRLVMSAAFLVVHGQLQREGEVTHLVARSFTDLSHRLSELREDEAPIVARAHVTGRLIRSRDFH